MHACFTTCGGTRASIQRGMCYFTICTALLHEYMHAPCTSQIRLRMYLPCLSCLFTATNLPMVVIIVVRKYSHYTPCPFSLSLLPNIHCPRLMCTGRGTSLRVCHVCVCVRVCVCVLGCVRVMCVFACVRVCVRASVPACVRAGCLCLSLLSTICSQEPDKRHGLSLTMSGVGSCFVLGLEHVDYIP